MRLIYKDYSKTAAKHECQKHYLSAAKWWTKAAEMTTNPNNKAWCSARALWCENATTNKKSKEGKKSMCRINTYYGHTIDYIHPNPDEIDIRDIAHNLSFENRFLGQTEEPYSVAQHCVQGSIIFEKMGLPDLALRFLLHDAAEAYLKDIPTPLKNLLSEPYRNIEDRFNEVIHQRFGLDYQALPAIKSMDLEMLAAEKAQLLPPSTIEWPQLIGIQPANVYLICWSAKFAESKYLEQFSKLMK